MLIIGDSEIESDTISVRKKSVGDLGKMTLSTFIDQIQEEIKIKN
jgi:threonyl-tRNA synthetase